MAKQGKTLKTRSGSLITPQVADDLAAEAERGYDLTDAKRHRIGHAEPTASRDRRSPTDLDSASWDDEDLSDDDRACGASGETGGRCAVARGHAGHRLNRALQPPEMPPGSTGIEWILNADLGAIQPGGRREACEKSTYFQGFGFSLVLHRLSR